MKRLNKSICLSFVFINLLVALLGRNMYDVVKILFYNKLQLCFTLLLLASTWFEFINRFRVVSKSVSYLRHGPLFVWLGWTTTGRIYSGFCGLEVACWPLVPKFAGSNPAEAVGFFRAKKILSTPSFGREVKPFVPCRRFMACKNP